MLVHLQYNHRQEYNKVKATYAGTSGVTKVSQQPTIANALKLMDLAFPSSAINFSSTDPQLILLGLRRLALVLDFFIQLFSILAILSNDRTYTFSMIGECGTEGDPAAAAAIVPLRCMGGTAVSSASTPGRWPVLRRGE